MDLKKNVVLPAISIIAPMYNVENYVGQCLDSILAQTFQDYELIIVDDCSTDNSAAIVEKYALRFGDKLKFVKMEKNTGAAALPRNYGITLAKGKYIALIDPDDVFTPKALEAMYKAAEETQADVVHTEKYFISEAEVIDNKTPLKLNTLEVGNKVDKPTFESFNLEDRIKAYVKHRFFWYPWGKLFRRDLVIENKVEFPNWPTADDTIFCFKCMCLAKNYVRIPDITNVYRIREGSLTNKDLDAEKYLHRWLQITIEGANIIDNFMDKFEIFVQKPILKYSVIDFFIQEKLNWISRVYPKNTVLTIYKLLLKEFSNKYGNNKAFISYIFNTMNVYRIRISQLQLQIKQLQQQINEFQQKLQATT